MRNTLPLLSRPVVVSAPPQHPQDQLPIIAPAQVPSIRLVSATPSATGLASDASTSFNNSYFDGAWGAAAASTSTVPTPLAPKANPTRKRLVPKKSKLGLLGNVVGGSQRADRNKDFSDVVRRVGGDSANSTSFEIFVDPTDEAEMGEVVMVQKKKSRVGLNGMNWGALGEVTNVPQNARPTTSKLNPLGAALKENKEQQSSLLKVKSEEKDKWWSIGRGRKDSKDEKKKEKEAKPVRAKSPEPVPVPAPPPKDPYPRSMTPDPFKPTSDSRARFNSLDSGIMLNGPVNFGSISKGKATANYLQPMAPSQFEPEFSRAGTPTIGGLLAPPTMPLPAGNPQHQGSIALRAMRSVRSLARIGSWAQLKSSSEDKENTAVKEKLVEIKEKPSKSKEKEGKEKGEKKKKRKENGKEKVKEKEKETAKSSTLRLSTSSFEAGALTASPDVKMHSLQARKKKSILGLGIPSSMRIQTARNGSTASSIMTPTSATMMSHPPIGIIMNTTDTNRLSVESATRLSVEGAPSIIGRDRAGSVMSTASSLRPRSTTSCTSGASSGSSVATSVRWDEEGLQTVKELRKKDRADRKKVLEQEKREAEASGKTIDSKTKGRKSGESRRSAEGRRRTPIADIFPDVAARTSISGDSVRSTASSVVSPAPVVEEVMSYRPPILKLERATADGHCPPDDEELLMETSESEGDTDSIEMGRAVPMPPSLQDFRGIEQSETPLRQRRPRPMSEQLLGRSRPRGMYETDDGVLSLLDAATNDLALLINNLDLQATPATPDLTPLRPSPFSSLDGSSRSGGRLQPSDSPLKGQGLSLRSSMTSISSLRPYGQSRGGTISKASMPLDSSTSSTGTIKGKPSAQELALGLRIAPWSTSPLKVVAPLKPKSKTSTAPSAAKNSTSPSQGGTLTFRRGHKRTMTPGPEPEPLPIFQPLQPPRPRRSLANIFGGSPGLDEKLDGTVRAPSSLTFGERSSSSLSHTDDDDKSVNIPSTNHSPVFTRAAGPGIRQKASFLIPALTASAVVRGSPREHLREKDNREARENKDRDSLPIPPEAKRVLGMGGTMGGSDVPPQNGEELDASDPDSDVPEELKVILGEDLRHAMVLDDDMDSIMDQVDPRGYEDDDMDLTQDHSQVLDYSNTFSYRESPPSPGLPPVMPLPPLELAQPNLVDIELPSFRFTADSLIPESVDQVPISVDMDVTDNLTVNFNEDGDTKKSFDFTGELRQLNESGGSDRRSFVEQLENAFRTPAKVDLRYGLLFNKGTSPGKRGGGGVLRLEVPPVPKLPAGLRKALAGNSSTSSSISTSSDEMTSFSASVSSSNVAIENMTGGDRIIDTKEPTMLDSTASASASSQSDSLSEDESRLSLETFSISKILNMKEPTLFKGTDSLIVSDDDSISRLARAMGGDDEEEDSPDLQRRLRECASSSSRGSSSSSNGELNRSFRFGGLPKIQLEESVIEEKEEKQLTLSDIIPPPGHHSRSFSDASSLMLEDDSVLKSIFAKVKHVHMERASLQQVQPRPRVTSNASSRRRFMNRTSVYMDSRRTSVASFTGFDSFEEVRRGFEFTGNSSFYPPSGANTSRRGYHRHHESMLSIASVSSLGHVINPGVADPFDFGLPSLRERPSSEDVSSFSMSLTVDDTFAFIDRNMLGRKRVASDASSFYFRAPARPASQSFTRGHRQRDSNLSVASLAPPVSLFNRSYQHHRRSDSSNSSASFSFQFGNHSNRTSWARHRRDQSMDSIMSDFSAVRLGRPGLGDKMFDMIEDQLEGMPLTSISASPPDGSIEQPRQVRYRASFDSILDVERRTSIMSDSLFEKTGDRSSASMDSVFGYDNTQQMEAARNGDLLLPPNQFRPLSMMSMMSEHSPKKEDDTMISMLGGGHVRRCSMASIIEASPCARVEKRKHSDFQTIRGLRDGCGEPPVKARIIEKPSVASLFGDTRMEKAQHGLLERQSLEESCLVADGEDLSGSFRLPVFSRPGPANRSGRSRSSTCTSSSSGVSTPPLSSASDRSSISEDSQSSLDLSDIDMILANSTFPLASAALLQGRARARGNGHRRRISQARASRASSVYETIQEELVASAVSSPASVASQPNETTNYTTKMFGPGEHGNTPTTTAMQPVFIVEPDMHSDTFHSESVASSPGDVSIWNDERGIVALRRYYALRNEADHTVTESKRVWIDTPFSLFAIQNFDPPKQPSGMQALLEHSVQTYGPLPSELRPRRMRSRTQSRPSPYPQSRLGKISASPMNSRTIETAPSTADLHRSFTSGANTATFTPPVLQERSQNINVVASPSPAKPVLKAFKAFSPLVTKPDANTSNNSINDVSKRENGTIRPRVPSAARRTALGWTKRNMGKEQKENTSIGGVGNGSNASIIMTPGDTLRLSRPRPKGRPTPASVRAKPIRV